MLIHKVRGLIMPKIREIAAILRAAIERGEYPPGTTIPREVDLADRFEVNRSTVRGAIALLRAEGLVAPTKRRGTVVRHRARIVLPIARYADATPAGGPWEDACAQQGLDGRTDVIDVGERPADETTAHALGIQPGDTVIHRLNHMTVDGHVAQWQETWLPHSIAAGTPLAAPERVTGGIYRGLADADHPPSVADEVVTGRMPTPDEAETLGLDQGSPVLDIRRTTRDRGGRAVVHTHIVVAADRVSLAYQQVL